MQTNCPSDPPRGPSWPVKLGHAFGVLPDKFAYLLRCSNTYGDVVDLSLGGKTYLLNHPDDIEHVLVRNHLNYEKTRRLTGKRGKRLMGDGLLGGVGQPAILQRRKLMPMMTHRSIAHFGEMMVRCARDLTADWKDGHTLRIRDAMIDLTKRILIMSLFNLDLCEEDSGLAQALEDRRRYIEYAYSATLPMPVAVPAPLQLKYRKATQVIDQFIDETIKARRGAGQLGDDLFGVLLNLPGENADHMTDRLVRDEATTLISTGYETLAAALTWTWVLLAWNPDAQRQMKTEIDAVLGDKPPTVDDVPRLCYTKMVFQEAMRLYPPTWIFVRVPVQDDRLPSGVKIKAGQKLYLSPYVTHRTPAYFPDPDRFDPNRFTDDAIAARHKLAYYPFSAGPRVCLGQHFAMMEGVLILAALSQHSRLELLPGQHIVPKPIQVLIPKNEISMRVVIS